MTETLRPIVFARYPEAGKCKTRLIGEVGAEGGSRVQKRLVERTLERLASLDPILSYTGASAAAFREWLPGVALLAQAEGDLGARMLAAMGEGPAVIVGSDVPDITAGAVQEAARLLGEADLVLGPAEDGGFWLIGVRAPDARLFADVDWGTGSVLAAVEANAKRLGWRTARAATLADLDRPEDLKRWPELAP